MAEIIVRYNQAELRGILTTAIEGGIGYWSELTKCKRAEEDGLAWYVELWPEDEDKSRPLYANSLQRAIDKILRGDVQINSEIKAAIMSADVGQVDAEAADCIVQVALFGKLVYG